MALLAAMFFAILAAPAIARADQCQALTPAQAAAAVMHLRSGRPYIKLCEPCGERFDPGAPNVRRVIAAMAMPNGFGAQNVMLDGAVIDLAYVFVGSRGGEFVNLARLSGCEATDVSTQLSVVPSAPPVGFAPPAVAAPVYAAPVYAAPAAAPVYAPPQVGIPVPPVAPPPATAPQAPTYRFAGVVGSTSGPAPVMPNSACQVQVQPTTNSARVNCRVTVTCGGQTLYGGGNGGFGVCGFNSVRTGLIFHGTATTISMEDRNPTLRDGDPMINLSLPNGAVIVQDAPTPVSLWTVAVRGLRQL